MPTVNIPPTDDAFVTENSNSGNGIASMIEVNNQGGGYETRGMMRFDLSSIPDGMVINSAKIIASDVITDGNPPRADVHRLLSDDWDELTVNGNNRPDFNPAPTTFLDYFPNTIRFDVTSDIAREFPSNRALSWIFIQGGTPPSFVSFRSKDHAGLPAHMTVDYSAAPTPQVPLLWIALALSAIGGLYYLLRKKRKK